MRDLTRRSNDSISPKDKASKQLASYQNWQGSGKELDKDTSSRSDDAGSESELPAIPLHGVPCKESANDLTDGAPHAQACLPWCRDDVGALI